MKVSRKDFGIKDPDHCMNSQKCKDKYNEYQQDYRAEFGVYPELDKINNPLTVLWSEPYDTYRAIMKRGFWGELFYHDVHARVNKRVKKFYHAYKKEWSFTVSLDMSRSTYFSDVKSLTPMEKIENGLGIRVDENGNYYEGTWKNGVLTYGFIYFSEQDTYFVGSIEENNDGITVYDGVVINISVTNKKKNITEITYGFGNFFVKKGEIRAYRGEIMCTNLTAKDNDIASFECEIGPFDDGYQNGKFIGKQFTNDNISVFINQYKDGELTHSAGCVFMILHFFLGFYMFAYFLYKYIVFWPIVLIYRSFQKKNWK